MIMDIYVKVLYLNALKHNSLIDSSPHGVNFFKIDVVSDRFTAAVSTWSYIFWPKDHVAKFVTLG